MLISAVLTGAGIAEQSGETISLTFSFGGDCTLGGDVNAHDKSFQKMADEMGYAYFFENVYDIFASDDMTIVNLEGPLTDAQNKRAERKFNFRCDPANVQILLEGSIETVNLANNHTYDFLEKGYADTLEALENAGIASYGYERIERTNIKGVRVSLVGLTERDHEAEDIAEILSSERDLCDILIVTFHWGEENNYRPSFAQLKLSRAAVEAGADLVVGHHTHVLGAICAVDGVNVVYSLGNLCFGGNAKPKDMDTMIYTHTFTLDESKTIISESFNVIPLILNSGTYRNNFRPTIPEADKADEIIKKIQRYSDIEISYTPAP